MYIIKVKGKVQIADYVQLRDDKFTLIAYFRADRSERALEKLGFGDRKPEIVEFIKKMPYGRIQKIDINGEQ